MRLIEIGGGKKHYTIEKLLLNTCILMSDCSRFRNYKFREIVQLYMKIIMNTKLFSYTTVLFHAIYNFEI